MSIRLRPLGLERLLMENPHHILINLPITLKVYGVRILQSKHLSGFFYHLLKAWFLFSPDYSSLYIYIYIFTHTYQNTIYPNIKEI